MDDEIVDLISFMKISKNRLRVLECIDDDIMLPSQIAKKTNIRINHVSRSLKELKEKDLVVCLNEDKKLVVYIKLLIKVLI